MTSVDAVGRRGPRDAHDPTVRAPATRGLPRRALVLLVQAWQLVVSPWYPPVCRFYPSCSTYAVRALEEHGAARGTGLAARRLLRCHPWNPGGVDHVPPRGGSRRSPAGGAREAPTGRPAA